MDDGDVGRAASLKLEEAIANILSMSRADDRGGAAGAPLIVLDLDPPLSSRSWHPNLHHNHHDTNLILDVLNHHSNPRDQLKQLCIIHTAAIQ